MPRSPNGYIIFYSFYKKILDEYFSDLSPQEKATKAGEEWNALPNHLKNSFIQYANNHRFLKTFGSQTTQQSTIIPQFNSKMEELKIIFDDSCRKITKIADNCCSNENLSTPENEDKAVDEMFKLYINEDAYQK